VRIWSNVSTNTRIKVLLLSEFKRVIPRTVVMPFSKAGSFRYGALHSPVSPMIMYLNRYEYDIVYVVWCSSSNKMSLMDDLLTTALSSTQDRSGRYNSNKGTAIHDSRDCFVTRSYSLFFHRGGVLVPFCLLLGHTRAFWQTFREKIS
jgi:hypothetical protein